MDFINLSTDPDRRQFNEVASLFDAPAYIRRGRGVEQALEYLVGCCQVVREEYLQMPRLLIGQLHALVAGDWPALAPLLADAAQPAVCAGLHATLAPKLRLPPGRTSSPRVLRNALRELVGSLERFNTRWAAYLERVDLTTVNELRVGYNRYYVLEKACALKSDLLARRGFQPLPPLDLTELQRHLPLLPVPRLAG
jgi:hypothetical protein